MIATFPRLRLQSADEAAEAGRQDAQALLHAIANIEQIAGSAELLDDALAGIIGLAADNRLDECQARKVAFCEVVGPVLHNAVGVPDQLEALRAKCALLSASLRQAEAMPAVAITDSEGGEL